MNALKRGLREMISAYLTCVRWTDCEEAHPGADYQLPLETRRVVRSDCVAFYRRARPHLALYHEQAPSFELLGNDLWLTRNHHGVGFWDLDLGDLAGILTGIAHDMGEQHAYVGSGRRMWLE